MFSSTERAAGVQLVKQAAVRQAKNKEEVILHCNMDKVKLKE